MLVLLYKSDSDHHINITLLHADKLKCTTWWKVGIDITVNYICMWFPGCCYSVAKMFCLNGLLCGC